MKPLKFQHRVTRTCVKGCKLPEFGCSGISLDQESPGSSLGGAIEVAKVTPFVSEARPRGWRRSDRAQEGQLAAESAGLVFFGGLSSTPTLSRLVDTLSGSGHLTSERMTSARLADTRKHLRRHRNLPSFQSSAVHR
jgi:hypothetical protein